MSTHNPGKAEERHFLESFAAAAAIALQVLEEREAPDFIVQVDGRQIGVEITKLFIEQRNGKSTMQAQESIANRIVGRAQRLYEVSGSPPANITVCFGPGQDLSKLNRDSASQALAAFVSSLALASWQKFDWRPDFVSNVLPAEISFIHALGVPQREMMHWSVARAGWVAPLQTEALQARVDEKVKRLPTYTTSITENWLIIVANAMNPSQLIEARKDFQPASITSPFARTYFYRHPESTVILLGEQH